MNTYITILAICSAVFIGSLGGIFLCNQSHTVQGIEVGFMGVILCCIGLYLAYNGFTGNF